MYLFYFVFEVQNTPQQITAPCWIRAVRLIRDIRDSAISDYIDKNGKCQLRHNGRNDWLSHVDSGGSHNDNHIPAYPGGHSQPIRERGVINKDPYFRTGSRI